MIGGFMKMTSRFALTAAAGALLMAMTPVKAADLGGGCCADLEERVAELEATTARKGNRVVSLQVYGQVNRALLFFDNGDEGNTYVVDNDYSGSRFGFTGQAALKPGWTAGYKIEINVQDASSDLVTEFNDEGEGPLAEDGRDNDGFFIRHSYFYLESERLGRLSIGQQSTAAEGAQEVTLGNTYSHSGIFVGNDISILGGDRLDSFASNLGSSRDDLVRYDSPSIYGFIVSASWGDDDYWDVALRFKKEWNSIRLAAAIAYIDDETSGSEFDTVNGSISVMHVPTGLFGAFQAGNKEFDSGGEQDFWYVQAGIQKQFLPYGSTTVYGEYGNYEIVEDNEADRWGFGLVQSFDSAAMDIYAQAFFYELDESADTLNGDGELSLFMLGSRIKF